MESARRLRLAGTASHRRARRQRLADRLICHVAAAALRKAQHHGSELPRILARLARAAEVPLATAASARPQGHQPTGEAE
eukprot:5566332-Alexandrium_andersonii.AAC.1